MPITDSLTMVTILTIIFDYTISPKNNLLYLCVLFIYLFMYFDMYLYLLNGLLQDFLYLIISLRLRNRGDKSQQRLSQYSNRTITSSVANLLQSEKSLLQLPKEQTTTLS